MVSIFIIIVALCNETIYAGTTTQNINVNILAFSKLGVSSDVTFTIDSSSVSQPGGTITAQSDQTSYLRYTVVRSNSSGSINASLDSNLPTGWSLSLTADSVTTGKGSNKGVSAGQVILSNIPQAILNSIGSCRTGTGVNDGSKLNYILQMDDSDNAWDAVKPGITFTRIVTFTINDI